MPEKVPGLVSVVIPTYNSERFVAEAVRSAFAQDYESIEVIVVDNNCTDSSIARARDAGPVRVVHCPPQGLSAARNWGIAAARGEYLQLLDADDFLFPDTVRRKVAALERTGADVAFGPFLRAYIAEDGSFPRPPQVRRPQIDTDDVIRSILGPEGFVQVAATLQRLTPNLRAIPFDVHCNGVEDQRWHIDVAAAGMRWAYAGDELTFTMREHDSADRVSAARGQTGFLKTIAETAERALAYWKRDGVPLTPARVDALVGVWIHAADGLAAAGDESFRGLLERVAQMDPDFRRRLPTPLRALSRVVGFPRAARVVDRVKRTRAAAGRAVRRLR